jgi:hypothetical protein
VQKIILENLQNQPKFLKFKAIPSDQTKYVADER